VTYPRQEALDHISPAGSDPRTEIVNFRRAAGLA